MTAAQLRQVPQESPSLAHVWVPSDSVAEHEHVCVAPGVQVQSTHAPHSVPPLLQVSVPTPPSPQRHDSVEPGWQNCGQSLQLSQEVPLLLHFSMPVPPPVQGHDCVALGVQVMDGQPSQLPHPVPALLQVSVPLPPPEQVHDCVALGVQVMDGQSPQLPHPVPALLQVSVPLPPPEQVHGCVALGVQVMDEQPAQLLHAVPSVLHVAVPSPLPEQAQGVVEFGAQIIEGIGPASTAPASGGPASTAPASRVPASEGPASMTVGPGPPTSTLRDGVHAANTPIRTDAKAAASQVPRLFRCKVSSAPGFAGCSPILPGTGPTNVGITSGSQRIRHSTLPGPVTDLWHASCFGMVRALLRQA
jgi:hypothetical protein